MLGGKNRSVQDPIFLLRQMGCDRVFDYRFIDYNLAMNLAAGFPVEGAPVAVNNGGLEAPYNSGVANGWGKVPTATGTFSEATGDDIPWESEGTSAQKFDSVVAPTNVFFTQNVSVTRYRTYKCKFKISVTSGTVRVRMAQIGGTFIEYGRRDFTPDNEAGEYFYYFIPYGSSATVNIELFRVSGTCTGVFDDFEMVEVDNDEHVTLLTAGFSTSRLDEIEGSYQFSGVSSDYGANWNVDDTFDNETDKLTAFCVIDPSANNSAVQSNWNANVTSRSWMQRVITPSSIEGEFSADGTAVGIYQEATSDPYNRGKFSWVEWFDGPGLNQGFFVDGEVEVGTYTSGSNPGGLLDVAAGVGYFIGAYINPSGAITSPFNGTMYLCGYFDDVLSDMEYDLINSYITNMR